MNHPIQLIAGLGNPGADYETTRHNAGAWFVEAMAKAYGGVFKMESKLQSRIAQVSIDGVPCRLLIPTTFMNHSGQAVAAAAQFYKIPAEAILVVHDELDLDPAIVRLKVAGGHGGHNGLRDIIRALGTPEFMRARIGIGHPGHASAVTNYVLSRPNVSDHDKIQQGIANLMAVIPTVVRGALQDAMQALH